MLLLSTSPGADGGATHLNYLIHSLSYQGAMIAASYSLPSFNDNFKEGAIVGDKLAEIKAKIEEFYKSLQCLEP